MMYHKHMKWVQLGVIGCLVFFCMRIEISVGADTNTAVTTQTQGEQIQTLSNIQQGSQTNNGSKNGAQQLSGGATGAGALNTTNNTALNSNDFSNGIVTCGRNEIPADASITEAQRIAQLNIEECNFQGFVLFINRLITYSIILATLIMVFAFGKTGWDYLNAQDKPMELTKLKEQLLNILIGMAILFGAWLVFRTFADTVLTSGYDAYLYLTK